MGAYTTGECLRIEMSMLLKTKRVKKNCITQSSLSWTNGSSISIHCHYTKYSRYIRLIYNNTHRHTGEVTKHDYTVDIEAVPSNLGKGEVLYFICPETGRRCRILYKASGGVWKSREAYANRIYYPTQLSCKTDRYNTRYWELVDQLEKMNKQRKTYLYKQEMTKRAIRADKKYEEMIRMDKLRFSPLGMSKRMYGMMQREGFLF